MKKIMTPSVAGSSKTMTVGQIDKAVANYRALLEKHADEFDSGIVQRVLGQSELADEEFAVFRRRVEMLLALAPRGSAEVTLAEQHDPNTFYQNRTGLYVWDEFRTQIVAKAKPSEAGTTHKVESVELMRDLVDKEIEDALPEDHLFNETSVCATIAGLIMKQANGEEGALVNNGRANLFYLSSSVVRAYWFAVRREWHVRTWERDDYRWLSGYRVFSPAN